MYMVPIWIICNIFWSNHFLIRCQTKGFLMSAGQFEPILHLGSVVPSLLTDKSHSSITKFLSTASIQPKSAMLISRQIKNNHNNLNVFNFSGETLKIAVHICQNPFNFLD